MEKEKPSWSDEHNVTWLLVVLAVLDELRKRGLIGSNIRLTEKGCKRGGDYRVGKAFSEEVFKQSLVKMKLADDDSAADFAKLARIEGLIADLDTGYDHDWITATLQRDSLDGDQEEPE